MRLFALYLLASLDGILCGVRTAMGRCPLISKRVFYARAALRGFSAAQVASLLALSALLLTVRTSGQEQDLHADLEAAAGRMLLVFLPYAVAVIVPLALRLVPSTDLRSATSVFALGPLTAVRPAVMIAGVLFGVWQSRFAETRLLGAVVLLLMLSLEWALNRVMSRAQELEIQRLV